MKVLFVEGQDLEVLRRLACRYPYPYRLLARSEEGLYLLEAWSVGADLLDAAMRTHGVRAWAFDVLEERRCWSEEGGR